MQRWARNIPVPEPHVIALGVGITAGALSGWTLSMPSWLRLAGLCLAGGGLAWTTWATFVSRETYLADPDRLISGGPYAVGRNPMYVGWTVAYVGVGLALASVWLVLLLPGVLLVTDIAVRREERLLRERFGPAYAAYAASVRRYV
jgi:protein-S-isoprenylcysteine O-methyltransferase Ste14